MGTNVLPYTEHTNRKGGHKTIKRNTCMGTICFFTKTKETDFRFENHKNQKGHMHGKELFVLYTKPNNPKTSKGTHVYGNELFVLQRIKIKKEQNNQKQHM